MERRTDTDRLAAFWRCVKRMRALQCSYFESRDWQFLTQAQDYANKMKGELENARRILREIKEREDSGQLEIFPEN